MCLADCKSQRGSIDGLVSVGGKRDGSSVQDPIPQASVCQRDIYWIEDGCLYDKDTKWIGLEHVVDQPRCLPEKALSSLSWQQFVHWIDASVEEIESY